MSIQAEKGALFWNMVGLHVRLDCPHGAAQLCAVLAVPRVAIRAEPLMGMGLQNGGAGAHDFPTFAPSVPRGTDLLQASLRCWPVRGLGQSALAGRLARAINVEDHSLSACSINKPADLALVAQRASQQIVEKQGTQGFDRLRGEARSKSARASSARACSGVQRAP